MKANELAQQINNLPSRNLAIIKKEILKLDDFIFLGDGDFRTCFLHTPSQTVFKISHNEYMTDTQQANRQEFDVWERLKKSTMQDNFAACIEISSDSTVLVQKFIAGSNPKRVNVSQIENKTYDFLLHLRITPFDMRRQNLISVPDGKKSKLICIDYAGFTLY